MNMSENINEIAEALSQFQAKVPTVAKNKTAGTGSYSYKYADIADVLTAIRGVLAENGLSVSQFAENESIVESGVVSDYVVITTMLMHKSGQWLKSSLRGSVSANQSRMSNMQSIGSITTYLRRYSLASMLGIATDDDIDGNLGDGSQSNAKIETENYRTAAQTHTAQIKNADVVTWLNNYLKNNRSLECMKKADTIAQWEIAVDKMAAEIVSKLQYVDEETGALIDKSLNKIQASRVANIESGMNYNKMNALLDRVNNKIEEMNA